MKRSGAFTTASANGSYWSGSMRWDDGIPAHTSLRGTLTVDGLGSFAETSSSANSEGTLYPSVTLVSGTYSVAADGALSVAATVGEVFNFAGGMLLGGELAILGRVSAGSAPGITLLMKK